MDEAFLAALGVAADSAESGGDARSADRLRAIRAEVLDQASSRLSPGLRVLDAATRAATPDKRAATVLSAAAVLSPPAPLIFSAASQLIDDMEAATVVPDAPLLSRLCLAREDVLDASSSAVLTEAVAAHAKMLHGGGVELASTLASNSSDEARPARQRLIARACFEDGAWEALAAEVGDGKRLGDDGGAFAAALPAGLSPAAAAGATAAASKRTPRPGRTLTALRALRDEMALSGKALEAAALETARLDVLAVLEGVAYRGELEVVDPAATVKDLFENAVQYPVMEGEWELAAEEAVDV